MSELSKRNIYVYEVQSIVFNNCFKFHFNCKYRLFNANLPIFIFPLLFSYSFYIFSITLYDVLLYSFDIARCYSTLLNSVQRCSMLLYMLFPTFYSRLFPTPNAIPIPNENRIRLVVYYCSI